MDDGSYAEGGGEEYYSYPEPEEIEDLDLGLAKMASERSAELEALRAQHHVRFLGGDDAELDRSPEARARRVAAAAALQKNVVHPLAQDSLRHEIEVAMPGRDRWVKDDQGAWNEVAEDAPADGYAAKPLGPRYATENDNAGEWRKGGVDGNAASDRWTTEYHDAAGQAASATVVGPASGRLADQGGRYLNGEFGYVVDPQTGFLHVFDLFGVFVQNADGTWASSNGAAALSHLAAKGSIAAVHHSSPLAGAPVAGAGIIRVDQGQILSVTDTSGHYAPEAEYTYQTVEALQEQGADLSRARVTLTGQSSGANRPAGKAWIPDGTPKDEVSMYASSFLETTGNEPQIRAKERMLDQLDPARRAQRGARTHEPSPYDGMPTATPSEFNQAPPPEPPPPPAPPIPPAVSGGYGAANTV